jgi:diadenosine tetraphosphate (Ap4A) HIT family hydrolase
MTAYNDQNIFAKILRGEIPNNTVYEDEYVLAFHDISPQAPIHILVIPKGAYLSIDDFGAHAPAEMVQGFFRAIDKIAAQENLKAQGFRCIANTGLHGGQEVPHFHMHILGGKAVGPMVCK